MARRPFQKLAGKCVNKFTVLREFVTLSSKQVKSRLSRVDAAIRKWASTQTSQWKERLERAPRWTQLVIGFCSLVIAIMAYAFPNNSLDRPAPAAVDTLMSNLRKSYSVAEHEIEEWRQKEREHEANKAYLKGLLLEQVEDLQGAKRSFEQAVNLQPDSIEYLLSLGITSQDLGEYELSIEVFNLALKLVPQVGLTSDNLRLRLQNRLAWSLYKIGDDQRAIELFRSVIEHCQKKESNYPGRLADAYNDLGIVMKTRGRTEEALNYYVEALNINLIINGDSSMVVATNHNNLGSLFGLIGENSKAIMHLNRSHEIRLLYVGSERSKLAYIYNNKGVVYRQLGDISKAIDYNKRAIRIRHEVYGKIHPYLADGYDHMGTLLALNDNFEEALAYHHHALTMRKLMFDHQHRDIALSYINIAQTQIRFLNDQQALYYCEMADSLFSQIYKDQPHWRLGLVNQVYSQIFDYRVDGKAAVDHLRKTRDIFALAFGPTSPKTLQVEYEINILIDRYSHLLQDEVKLFSANQ